MAAGNTALYASEALFNMIVQKFVAGNGGGFEGSKVIDLLGIEFVFSLDAPPTADLGAQSGGGNIAFRFDKITLAIYEYKDGKRGALQNSVPVSVLVTGVLELAGQNLSVRNLKATGSGKLDERAASMMNETIVPQFEQSLASIPIPDLRRVIGLPIEVVGLEVTGSVIRIDANVGNSNDRPAVPAPNISYAGIVAAISSGVVNELAGSQFPGVRERVGDSDSGWWGEGQVTAHASADNPNITIAGGRGYGSIAVAAGAGVGYKPPFAGWIRPAVSIGIRTPELSLRLESFGSNRTMRIRVFMDQPATLDLGLPVVLKPIEWFVNGVIQPLAGLVTNAINAALQHISIEAFTLPTSIPGTTLPATLSFADTSFQGNSVVAAIKVD